MFTLTTGVTGIGELQSENIRPGPMLVVRDRVSMAYMWHPSLPTYVSVWILSVSIDSGVGWSLTEEISFFGLPRPGLGKWGAACSW